MSIIDVIRPYNPRLDALPTISPEASSVEWMEYMRTLFERTIQTDAALRDNEGSSALQQHIQALGQIDSEIGHAAELTSTYIEQFGPRNYNEKGYALDESDDALAPYEIDVVRNAIGIYERTRTDNSRALVEALLIKYSGSRIDKNGTEKIFWPAIADLKEDYKKLLDQLEESPELKSA